MAEKAEITVSQDEDICTVTASGELDLRIAQEFENALSSAAMTAKPVVVDLRSAVYVDTAILAGLAKLAIKLQREDGRMKVQVTSGSHPEYVLKTVGFDHIMEIEHIPSNPAIESKA